MMAQAGDIIEDPVRGERIVFQKTARDTQGEFLRFDFLMKPGVAAIPRHVHPRQEERVEVIAGTVRYRLGGSEHTLAAGQSAVLPAGIPHTLWNAGDDQVHAVFEVHPALKTELAFETLFGLARAGKTNRSGMPNPLQGALLARDYETFLAWPPVAVQKAAMGLMAPLARLLGYRARYPEYSGPE
jgi:quercetin dioxygenase-like cupin family protein